MGGADHGARITLGQNLSRADGNRGRRIAAKRVDERCQVRGRRSVASQAGRTNSHRRKEFMDRNCAGGREEPADSANAGSVWRGSVAAGSSGNRAGGTGTAGKRNSTRTDSEGKGTTGARSHGCDRGTAT